MTGNGAAERLFAIERLLDSIVVALTAESVERPAPITGTDGRVAS